MPSPPRVRSSRCRLVLAGLALMLAAACGSDQDEGEGRPTADTGVVQDTVLSDREPQPGGILVYTIGNETDGWNPTVNAWAPEGVQVALTVYDPLTAYDADGEPQPYLAESVEPNEDFTEWTITLREGITFHNGDPLTADAVKTILEAHRDSALSAPAVAPLESVDVVDPLTAVVKMNTPWVAFPQMLTAQMGVVPHPSIIEDEVNDEPIGTGPFTFVEWVPDRHFIAERNPSYWRSDEYGNPLPYLDRVEFRPINDPQTRRSSFEAGELDILVSGDPKDSVEFEQQAETGDEVQFFADRAENEENFVMLNLEAPPFDDPQVRHALALATDAATYNEVINEGATRMATGPFVPENPFAIPACFEAEDDEPCADYPAFDPDEARRILEEIEAQTGEPVSFALGNTPNTLDREQSALLEGMWEEVGFDVELSFTEQGQYIVETLAGDYQAVVWRQFGQPDPDSDAQWWYSDSGLNFANIADPEIDDALDRGRSDPDPDARAAAYTSLQQRFAELLPYIWTNHSEWAIVARPWVQQIPSGSLPDGSPSKPFVTGTHRITQIWIDETLR